MLPAMWLKLPWTKTDVSHCIGCHPSPSASQRGCDQPCGPGPRRMNTSALTTIKPMVPTGRW